MKLSVISALCAHTVLSDLYAEVPIDNNVRVLDKHRIKSRNARSVLSRVRRANAGMFEEWTQGNLERECIEEPCDSEELREITNDDEKTYKTLWKKLTQHCSVEKCNPQGSIKCIQTWNARECVCKPGWEGGSCDQDRDECNISMSTVCTGDKKICLNTLGSFRCECENGYTQAEGETDCTDIDECATGTHQCDDGALCTNMVGSYTCDGITYNVTAPPPTVAPTVPQPITAAVTTDSAATTMEDTSDDEDHGGPSGETDSRVGPSDSRVGPNDPKATEPSTEMPATVLIPTRSTPQNYFKNCEKADPCVLMSTGDGRRGACDHTCIPLCTEECNCAYRCACNVGYELACDQRTCARI